MPQPSTRPRRASWGIAVVALLLGLPTAAAATPAGLPPATTAAGSAISPSVTRSAAGGTPLCATTAAPGQARCLTLLKTLPTGAGGHARSAASTADLPAIDLGAKDLQKAYGLTSTLLARGKGETVGIVDAYGYPQAEADLAVYRKQYGLPACTKASGCLRQLDQTGTSTPAPAPPLGSESWQIETALDMDMVSAACPKCTILLVEANSTDLDDLGAAVDTAVAAGAADVSNSYAGPEAEGVDAYAHYWTHAGVPIVASTGDAGYGTAQFPAVIPGVVAVGGTELVHASTTSRGYSETAWNFASSGCSAYFAKPSYQPGNHCFKRVTGDVSSAADNIIIYNSTVVQGYAIVAGTSASAPFIAGVIALAGNTKTYTPKYSYQHKSALHDVVGGTNAADGFTCGTDYLCNAVKGYDGPTGVGTPNGIAGF